MKLILLHYETVDKIMASFIPRIGEKNS